MPLFTISDVTVKFKLSVDGILGEYGAAVVDKKDPKVTFTGWGSETSHAMFRPLHHSLTVNIGYVDKIDTSDLGLTPEVQATINQRVAKLSVKTMPKLKKLVTVCFLHTISYISTCLDLQISL